MADVKHDFRGFDGGCAVFCEPLVPEQALERARDRADCYTR